MYAPWKVGDVSALVCRRCHRIVPSRIEQRTVQLRGTRLRVPAVLVAVCPECDHTIGFTRHAIAQMREVASGK